MDKQTLRLTLQNYGRALAENMLPLTFIVGSEMEFKRVDTLNDSEPGKLLRSFLEQGASEVFNIPVESMDDLLVIYYLMLNTSVLIEKGSHSSSTGSSQPSVDRYLYTLDEEEIKDFYRLFAQDYPEKASKDLESISSAIGVAYNTGQIKGIKIDLAKRKTVKPRTFINFDNSVHVIPTDVIIGYQDALRNMCANNILKITYKRVNLADREQFVTVNRQCINDVYKDDLNFADSFFNVSNPTPIMYHGLNTYTEALKGFWKVGDLGISRFSFHGHRHLSLSRIMSITYATHKDYEQVKKYVNVDLEGVEDAFAHFVSRLEEEHLKVVRDSLGVPPDIETIQFVKGQIAIFTTMYRKSLHDYMALNQEMFKGYTGIKDNMYSQTQQFSGKDVAFGKTMHMDF